MNILYMIDVHVRCTMFCSSDNLVNNITITIERPFTHSTVEYLLPWGLLRETLSLPFLLRFSPSAVAVRGGLLPSPRAIIL